MYNVVFSKQAVKDVKKLKTAGLESKAKSLVAVVREDPYGFPPAFEPLVGNFIGMFSRRINRQHRFVYEVINEPVTIDGVPYEGTVKVLSMWTHYKML